MINISSVVVLFNPSIENIINLCKISELSKKSVIVIENPSTTTMPLFQISKYCSSVNIFSHLNDKTDTISELTMDP